MTRRQRLVNLGIAAVIAVVAVIVILATTGGPEVKETPRPAVATVAPSPAATTPAESSATAEASATPTEGPDEPAVPSIEVKNGKVVGGIAKFRVKQGEELQFSVTADVADEVHVHAYDFMKDVEPGKPVKFDFKADITGITEVELEDAGLQIASIRVDP